MSSSAAVSSARVDRLRATLSEPLLVTGAVNVAYLTGFTSRTLPFPSRRNACVSSLTRATQRRVEQSRASSSSRPAGSSSRDLATRLEGTIGFEADHVSYTGFGVLGSGGLDLVPTRGVIEALRAVKDENEVETIRRASLIADRSFEQLLAEEWVGRSELDLARRLRVLVLEAGGDDVAFDVIVGSGPNGALPHARPGSRAVEEGDAVVVDFGVLSGGYRSDVARTVHVGEVPVELTEIFDICLQAHLEAIARIVRGCPASRRTP